MIKQRLEFPSVQNIHVKCYAMCKGNSITQVWKLYQHEILKIQIISHISP